MKRWQQLTLTVVLVAVALVMMQRSTDQVEERRRAEELSSVPSPAGTVPDAGAVIESFVQAALVSRDRAEAQRWVSDPEAPWFRSQLGFLAGAETVDFTFGEGGVVTIRKLVVAGEEYSGEMKIEVAAGARKVERATLRLQRADGVVLSF